MRVCFVDYAVWDYNVDAPTVIPLGGSQSALCYLAAAMARNGHAVTALTGTTKPGSVLGVECLNLHAVDKGLLHESDFDAVIVLNGAGYSKLKDILPASTRLILWTQHEPVQPAMRKLALPEVSDKWDGIVCVSDWQRNAYIEAFKIAPERMAVLRNAIAPSFEGLFLSKEDMVNAKSNPLTLAYTSTPYRGLHHLLDIFPEVKRDHPEASLHVYSSMAVYQKHEAYDADMFKWVYDALDGMDGVDYAGSLPQPQLAERLAVSHVLAYPNIFPETSCISAMEAMAAGLKVVTSDFAALPETTEGFADLVPINFKDQKAYVRDYTGVLSRACSELCVDALWAQVAHMNSRHTWAVRASQWTEYLHAA